MRCNPVDYGSRFALTASGGSCGGLIIFMHHLVGAGYQMGSGPDGIRVELIFEQLKRLCGSIEVVVRQHV